MPAPIVPRPAKPIRNRFALTTGAAAGAPAARAAAGWGSTRPHPRSGAWPGTAPRAPAALRERSPADVRTEQGDHVIRIRVTAKHRLREHKLASDVHVEDA